jgi:hypothetical protein
MRVEVRVCDSGADCLAETPTATAWEHPRRLTYPRRHAQIGGAAKARTFHLANDLMQAKSGLPHPRSMTANVPLQPTGVDRKRYRPVSPPISLVRPNQTSQRAPRRSTPGVYGERYIVVPSQILLLCNLQRSLNALGLHRHAETSSAASYLDRAPHHLAPLCAQTATPLLVHANTRVTFCILDILLQFRNKP